MSRNKLDKTQYKSCIFCWLPLDTSQDEIISFVYNQRTYRVHRDCLGLWELTCEAIHSGKLLHGYEYEDTHMIVLQTFANKFFKNLKLVDRSALTRERDYLTYVD